MTHPNESDVDRMTGDGDAMYKVMLMAATMIGTRSRDYDAQEAAKRLKAAQLKAKEAKQLAEREARELKAQGARDPRVLKALGIVDRELALEIAPNDRHVVREMARPEPQFTSQQVQRPLMEFDSPERRLALALELKDLGVEPELIEVRMLAEMAQGRPMIDAAREPITGPAVMGPALDMDLTRDRERER